MEAMMTYYLVLLQFKITRSLSPEEVTELLVFAKIPHIRQTLVIILAHNHARDCKSDANITKASADSFPQFIAPLSQVTMAHCKKEDKDDGENSKNERERARDEWRCKEGSQRQRDRRQAKRQTEWQQNWKAE